MPTKQAVPQGPVGKAIAQTEFDVATVRQETRKRNMWAYIREDVLREWAGDLQRQSADPSVEQAFANRDMTALVRLYFKRDGEVREGACKVGVSDPHNTKEAREASWRRMKRAVTYAFVATACTLTIDGIMLPRNIAAFAAIAMVLVWLVFVPFILRARNTTPRAKTAKRKMYAVWMGPEDKPTIEPQW